MRKLLFIVVMIWTSQTRAQSFIDRVNAHRETSFGMRQDDIYHRHVVRLQNNEKMIVELTDVTDYTLLRNFDSLLETALNDAAFYKDSIQPLEHVRMDYDVKLGSDDVLMRFKRYNPTADVYVKRHGNTSPMKIDRDTFRIIIRKPLIEHYIPAHPYDYPMQVTFVMNNYTNLHALLADRKLIMQSIDTLMQAIIPKHLNPDLGSYQSYAEYEPYSYDRALYIKKIEPEQTDNKWRSYTINIDR